MRLASCSMVLVTFYYARGGFKNILRVTSKDCALRDIRRISLGGGFFCLRKFDVCSILTTSATVLNSSLRK